MFYVFLKYDGFFSISTFFFSSSAIDHCLFRQRYLPQKLPATPLQLSTQQLQEVHLYMQAANLYNKFVFTIGFWSEPLDWFCNSIKQLISSNYRHLLGIYMMHGNLRHIHYMRAHANRVPFFPRKCSNAILEMFPSIIDSWLACHATLEI